MDVQSLVGSEACVASVRVRDDKMDRRAAAPHVSADLCGCRMDMMMVPCGVVSGNTRKATRQAMCDAYSLIGPTRDFSKPFTASGNEQSRDIFPPPASELIPL